MQLAFKAREIEELADVYFFRPLGMVFALAARALGLTPTAVTVLSTLFGVAGGILLYWPQRALAGFVLIVFCSILDSSDGQLARLTGRSSEFGRLIDGISGYTIHTVIFVTLGIRLYPVEGGSALWWMFAAGFSTMLHAQLYDFYRTAYIRCAVQGRPRLSASAERAPSATPSTLLRWYEEMAERVSGLHSRVESAMAVRAAGSADGLALDEDRRRYRARFFWTVRGWNLFGDNTRIYAIGVVAFFNRPEWFFTFLFVPMNVVLVLMWLWQQRADRRFLNAGVID